MYDAIVRAIYFDTFDMTVLFFYFLRSSIEASCSVSQAVGLLPSDGSRVAWVSLGGNDYILSHCSTDNASLDKLQQDIEKAGSRRLEILWPALVSFLLSCMLLMRTPSHGCFALFSFHKHSIPPHNSLSPCSFVILLLASPVLQRLTRSLINYSHYCASLR